MIVSGSLDEKDNTGVNTVLNTGLVDLAPELTLFLTPD